MKPTIRITDRAEKCLIEIEGTIGVPEAWQFEEPEARVATYETFRETLRRIAAVEAREIEVEIRSTGGDVNDALLIHDALRSLGGRVTTRCHGYTASAATLIAQAASEGCREIAPSALYLIHRAACATEGNAAELAATVDLLRRTDERIAAVYADRSGRPAADFERLMGENNGAGRWLSPAEAVAAGLADRIAGEEGACAEKPKASGERPRAIDSLRAGWQRLIKQLRAAPDELPPAVQHNVLHPDPATDTPPAADALAAAAAERARSAAEPTRTLPREDPPLVDNLLSANQRAYAEDAKRFRS
ncbi:Clp protease ClpP [Alistipes sp.]|uniref:Clp protease ClpP n=1 Tax=Alistipes sp. TaxID=1872444 RepID=UPI0011DD415E|nr:Clp protease ClpP [Alistipes sp.]